MINPGLIEKPKTPFATLEGLPAHVEYAGQQLANEVERDRVLLKELGITDIPGIKKFIMVRVRLMIEQDYKAHTMMRMPEAFDNTVLSLAKGINRIDYPFMYIIYSDAELFTTDYPFFQAEDNKTGTQSLIFVLTPHHVLACLHVEVSAINLGLLMQNMPYFTFSTKIIAARPLDIAISWLAPLPRTIDPKQTSYKRELGQEVLVRFSADSMTVIRK